MTSDFAAIRGLCLSYGCRPRLFFVCKIGPGWFEIVTDGTRGLTSHIKGFIGQFMQMVAAKFSESGTSQSQGKIKAQKMKRGTIKIGAPENRIIYAYKAFVLTPRDADLLNPVLGPVLPLHLVS